MPISRRAFARGTAGFGAMLAGRSLRAARPVPKLLVLIAVEACRSDSLERNRASLSKNGLRRLMDEGCYFPDCRMAASTFTSSGLATLATGTWPQLHGIVADTWYEPGTHQLVKAGPDVLAATGLGDQIARDLKSRVFSIGLDQNRTALLAGRNPMAVFSLNERGEFVVHGRASVAWFGAFQRANPATNLHNASWLALGAPKGSQALRVLKYDPARPQDFVFLYKASPFAQSNMFDLAHEVIVRESLGQGGGGIDYLVVSPGSTSLLGYDVGSDSPLMDQLMLHLDREIEKLLDTLNSSVGFGNYTVVFTAAHGGPPQPPPVQPRPAVSGEALVRTIERALVDRFKTVFVDRYVYPFLYLKIPPTLDHRQVRAAAARMATARTAASGCAVSAIVFTCRAQAT
jgi:hypothetical protein